MKKKQSILIVLLLMAVTSVMAQSPYSVTMQEGTEDANNWGIVPNSTEAGQQVAATYSGTKHVKSVKYVKKLRTPVVTPPTAKSLTYSGSAQELVNAGTTTGGTLQYKVGTGSYSTSVPNATNAGTYTVYYKVVGGEAYSDVAEASVTVTINKAAAAAKSSKTNWVVGDIICTNGNAYTINANTYMPTGVTPTAIIVYKGGATGDADYKNGLALALTDADPSRGDGYLFAWKSSSGASDNSTKITEEYPTTAESGRVLTIDGTRNATTATARTGWPAFNYAARYTVSHPSSTSGWFLPSIYQWNLMVKTLLGVSSNLGFSENKNMGFEKINEKLQKAIDDVNVKAVGLVDAPYWTASEYNKDNARCYRANGRAGYNAKTGTMRVRPFIAF